MHSQNLKKSIYDSFLRAFGKISTVKLGYNEPTFNEHHPLGYNEQIVQSQMIIYYTNEPGYNDPR